jgi:hypothetical protein
LQFDRLEGILDRQVHIRNSENVGKTTEKNLVADQTATLIEQDGIRQGAEGHKMAKHFEEGNGRRADVDLSESSVYGNGQTELDSDDVATADRIDRLESITGGVDEDPPVFEGRLRRQFDALDASTEEELEALKVDRLQGGDPLGARDGSGRVTDDVAEEQVATFTEVGPASDDRGGESLAPGREDTSATLRRHRLNSEAGGNSDAILEGNIDPPLDEGLEEDDPEHRGQSGA